MKVWLILLLLSLSACSDYNGDRALKNYQQRLARVLETEVPPIAPQPAATLQAERDLKQPLPDLRLDLTDAYATRRCGLDVLIGERNSSLGKVYPASKQLAYELRFLAQLQHCLSLSWDDSSLLNQLQSVYQQKQHSIALAFDNMLLTDDTLRKELLGNRKTLALKQAPGLTETWQALTELNRLAGFIANAQWQDAVQIDIEQQLQTLYRYNFAGKLQYSLRHSRDQLLQINQMLRGYNNHTLCPPGRNNPKLDILANVFNKFYIAEVQYYTSALGHYQQEIWPLVQQLYQHTPLYPALQQRFEQSHNEMRTALSQHVNWWQQLNQQCPLQLQPKQ